jgi:hypothetical protein
MYYLLEVEQFLLLNFLLSGWNASSSQLFDLAG